MVSKLLILLGVSQSIFAAPYNVWSELADINAGEAEAELVSRDVDCKGGMGTPYDSSCWNTLDITKFLTQWNQTAPKCSSHDDGTNCCGPSNNPDETWSNCFLRMSLGTAGHDCSVINTKNCLLEDFKISDLVNSSQIPQVRYVVRNIYGKSSIS